MPFHLRNLNRLRWKFELEIYIEIFQEILMNWSIVDTVYFTENQNRVYKILENWSSYKNLVHDLKCSLALSQVYNYYLKYFSYIPAECIKKKQWKTIHVWDKVLQPVLLYM
jgi:hypothetical protein